MSSSKGPVATVTRHYEPQKHADLLNAEYCRWGRFLRDADGWDRRTIDNYQLEQAKEAVKFAYENTTGYRALYDDYGVSPDSIEAIDDLRKFPFVTKEMLRDNLEDFSVQSPDCEYVTTGGSTGIPFGFYRDKSAFAKELASKAHQYHRIGWKEGDRQIVFRGLNIPGDDHVRYYPQFNELRCSSYHLLPENMEFYRKCALDYRPEWIRCYPSSGCLFAKFIQETNREFPPVKGILCASENLYDFQKKLLSEVFGARVFSHYGHYELSAMASFCEHEDTYHVLPQYGYVELLDADGGAVTEPACEGEIVATSFIMRATPFVRYKTGDIAVLKGTHCPACARPHQIWDRIEGRLQEIIVTGTGRYISMTAMNMHDDTFDRVKQFQFYQAEKGKATFRYIPKPGCDGDAVRRMKSRLSAKLGDDMQITMQPVDEIPLTKRGKYRFLIQELEIDAHNK